MIGYDSNGEDANVVAACFGRYESTEKRLRRWIDHRQSTVGCPREVSVESYGHDWDTNGPSLSDRYQNVSGTGERLRRMVLHSGVFQDASRPRQRPRPSPRFSAPGNANGGAYTFALPHRATRTGYLLVRFERVESAGRPDDLYPSSNHPVYGPTCILADIDRGSLQAADAYGALLELLRSFRLVRLRPKKMTRCRLRRLVA